MKRTTIRLLIIIAALALHLHPAYGEDLTLAAGAGYKRPLSEIVKAYEDSSAVKIDQIYGNMGQVVMQAKAGGNIAFIVGEATFLRSARGLEFASFHPVGEGILVIAYGKKIALQTPEDLVKPEIAKVAIPDEKHAIYGKAGKEFLKNSSLLTRIQDKLLVVATVPQVSAYLISGEVEAGFINLTDALYIKDKIGGFLKPDKAMYDPIKLVVGVVKGHEDKPDVKKFLTFLSSDPKVKEILTKAGL